MDDVKLSFPEPNRLMISDMSVCLSEDDQKEKSLSHHTIQQLIIEKDQALADLNSVEKSLADLFRRYEKMKDRLEGFRKVTHKFTSLKVALKRLVKNLKGSFPFLRMRRF